MKRVFFFKSHVSIFTLLELLIILALIIILTSLLLPALRSAKDKSLEIHCMGNLKQLFIAAASYCNDSLISQMGSSYWHSCNWHDRLGNDGYITKVLKDSYGNPLGGVLKCPAERRFSQSSVSADGWRGSHYGLNWHMGRRDGSGSNDSLKWMPKEAVKESSKTMYFSDATWKFEIFTYTYDPDYGSSSIPTYFRHSNRMNYVFIDGHAQSGSYKTVPVAFTVGSNASNYYFWYRRYPTSGVWLEL